MLTKILTILSLTTVAFADMEYPDISRSGKLFTVKVTPGDKNLSVNIAGNKTLDLQWDKTGLQAYLILGKTVKPLKVTKDKAKFIINEDLPRPSEIKLEVSNGPNAEAINVPLR